MAVARMATALVRDLWVERIEEREEALPRPVRPSPERAARCSCEPVTSAEGDPRRVQVS
jgi:hypothetical protein